LENASEVAAGIALNEKIAALSLPDNKGRLDFNSGFTSDNPAFRRTGSRSSIVSSMPSYPRDSNVLQLLNYENKILSFH
jgi:hypothetical protein